MVLVADTQSTIIGLSDALAMNASKEVFFPLLKDLVGELNQIPFEILEESKIKMKNWLFKLTPLKVTDVLDEQTNKELAFDLGAAQDSFRKGIAGFEK